MNDSKTYKKNHFVFIPSYLYNLSSYCQKIIEYFCSPVQSNHIARYAKVVRFKNKKKINHINFKIKSTQGYKHYSFVKAFMHDPKSIGSICPSSPILCKAIVELIPKGDGLIIDLGSGTGVVSKCLLEMGFDPNKIIAIENSKELSLSLEKSLPNIHVVCGDARELDKLINGIKTANHELSDCKVHAIISSLPFQSIPKSIADSIFAQLKKISKDNKAYLLQYTYAVWKPASLSTQGFQARAKCFVARNLPPARVDLYSYS